ncbi:MAG TPA: DUF1152 domain-containing protein [Thermoleophilaceae bacterium]|jgi:hypothetical protein|nr:DUF1152 domain-containing protein [Thermoleophilaceae bacterium]
MRELATAKRPLVLGIGGGGDVVGALAVAEHSRLFHGANPIVGGVTWERSVVDPEPGPRTTAEIANALEIAPGILAASGETVIRDSDIPFAESRVAGMLGVQTVLVDVTLGPRAIADGLEAAAQSMGCDLIVFLDVGGDALAHGDEPGLGSPLCDAVMLAAADVLAEREVPVLGALFGTGCDGELTPAQVLERLSEVGVAGGLAGAMGLTPEVVSLLEQAVDNVPTEASAQTVAAFRGVSGDVPIRNGRRTVHLSPLATVTFFFLVPAAVRSAARLALAVRDADDLDEANAILRSLGVSTELDWEMQQRHESD